MANSNMDIIRIAIAVAIGSYLGWLNFQAINDLFPSLADLEPALKLLIGMGGIFLMVKLGMRKQ